MPMDKGMRGFTAASLSLQKKDQGAEVDMEKKVKVIKDIVKDKTKKGKDNFDPDPEIEEKDTMVKT